MILLRLLALLVLFLRPAVAGEGGDSTADAGTGDSSGDAGGDDAGDAGDVDDQQDLNADDAGDAGDDGEGGDKTASELEAARREAKEAKEARERVEQELAQVRRGSVAPSEEERIRAEEDKRLQSKDATDLEKWQIAANRELRAGRSAAQFALAQAHDVSDRTAFSSVCMSDPLAKRYESRVEQELAQVRAKGGNASRESIYTYLLGKDMREGKFKKKGAAKTSSQGGAQQTGGVNRGKLPGARSDVRTGSGLTRKQQLEKKLENMPI